MDTSLHINDIYARLPEIDRYPTVAGIHAQTQALAEAYPDRVWIWPAGQSREGRPIDCLQVGQGHLHAVVIGGADANEPLGPLAVLEWTRLLCEDAGRRGAMDYTWYFVPLLDPDGMTRNQRWFGGPFTLTHYARHNYRPPESQRPEFCFPIQYKTLSHPGLMPETQALMRVIDEARPDFLFSIHQGDTGGVTYAVNRPAVPLYHPLHAVAERFDLVYLHQAMLGSRSIYRRYAPGIFQYASSVYYKYNAYLRLGVADPAAAIVRGDSAESYAEGKYGTFALMARVDMRAEPRVADTTPTGRPLVDVLEEGEVRADALDDWISAVLWPVSSDFELAFNRAYLRARMRELKASEAVQVGLDTSVLQTVEDRQAVAAEVFAHLIQPRLQRLREMGLYLGMLEREMAAGNRAFTIQEAYVKLAERFEEVAARLEYDLNYRMVPLREMVAFQIGSGMAAAAYVEGLRLARV